MSERVSEIAAIELPAAPRLPAQVGPMPFHERLRSMFEHALSLSRHPADPLAEPFKWVALLNFYIDETLVGFGTGFVIKSDVIVSAAHNFLMSRWQSIGVFPAVDQHRNPVSSISGVACAWDESRDCAVIILEHDVPSFALNDATQSRDVVLAGYAYPYPDGSPRMTFGTGESEVVGRQAEYRIAARQGDSGGPVFASGGGSQLIAMHSQTRLTKKGQVGVGELIDREFRQLVTELERRARAKRRK